MTGQTPDGTSESLTVDSAASLFEGILSDEENSESHSETSPSEDATATGTDEQTEQHVEDGQSDEETESAQDEESEQEETDEEQSPEPRVFKVKVADEELEVTEDELLKGYSRTADYTRKTQALAEERRALEAEAMTAREERQQYAAGLTKIAETLAALNPQEPDWDTLRQENPAEFATLWAEWSQFRQRQASIEAERQRVQEKTQQDMVAHMREHLSRESERLVEAIPTWKDAEVASKEKAELANYAREIGFADDDLAKVVDHRVVLMLRKAMMFDKAQKQRPIVQQKIAGVKAATPGPRGGVKPKSSASDTARRRLAQTGSVEDAAALFETLID